MRKLLMVMVIVIFSICLLVGCTITDILTPEGPEVVEPVMEAIATAKLVEGEGDLWSIEWSIVNIGDTNIEIYIIAFDVYYPINAKDNVIVEISGGNLEVGEFHQGKVDLLEYGAPDLPGNVSVTWKLF